MSHNHKLGSAKLESWWLVSDSMRIQKYKQRGDWFDYKVIRKMGRRRKKMSWGESTEKSTLGIYKKREGRLLTFLTFILCLKSKNLGIGWLVFKGETLQRILLWSDEPENKGGRDFSVSFLIHFVWKGNQYVPCILILNWTWKRTRAEKDLQPGVSGSVFFGFSAAVPAAELRTQWKIYLWFQNFGFLFFQKKIREAKM